MSVVPSNTPREEPNSAGGLFYRCNNHLCGLRFPVAPGDSFQGCCPRCGGPVQLVAQANRQEPFPTSGQGHAFVENQHRATIHLLLDNWRSLFNVGAAFRTADGAGAEHLYLCGITATPDQHPKLAKTALGAEKAVAWSYHADAVTLAASLRSAGALLWVLERDSAARSVFDITSLRAERPVVLAAGNEVVGVDPDLVEVADQVIQLPMMGKKESLNVAIALSIATYWLRAQRTTVHEVQSPSVR